MSDYVQWGNYSEQSRRSFVSDARARSITRRDQAVELELFTTTKRALQDETCRIKPRRPLENSGTYGSETITTASPNWVLPHGAYQFASVPADVSLEVFDGTNWQGASVDFTGGLVRGNGTHTRLRNTGVSDVTVHYILMDNV